MHEAFGGEAGELAAEKAGNFWLVNFGDAGDARLREAPCADGCRDAKRQRSFGEAIFRIGKADVGEDIASGFFGLGFS